MAGELCVASEAVDRADLAEQLGGAQRSAAGQLEQPGRDRLGACLEFAIERADLAGQRSAAAEQVAGDPQLRRLLVSCELTPQPVKPDLAVECAERECRLRVELV